MYIFDNKTQCFFPLALKDRYIAAGTWPENGVEVDDDTSVSYTHLTLPTILRV